MSYTDMEDFASLAQAFVEATSPLVSHRTINIMDLDGIIIASTEKNRIGSFHQGAKEAADCGRPVRISRENLHLYQGAREGYNMPLFQNDRLIGVVGLYGQEEEVRDAANLLRLYVIQYFERLELERKRRYERGIREELLKLYLRGDPGEEEGIRRLSERVSVYLRYPLVLFAIRHEREGLSESYDPELCVERHINTRTEKFIGQNDLYGRRDESCLILHSLKGELEEDRLYCRLLLLSESIPGFRFSVSEKGKELSELPECCKEAMGLLETGKRPASLMRDPSDRSRYYIRGMLSRGGARYIRELQERLFGALEEKQRELLLLTAEIYYEEGGSVGRAAQRLGVHKNTLQYRMHQLYELLFPEEEVPPFERELFIRMLIDSCFEKNKKEKGG